VANRIIPIETKVNALSQCLALQNVEAVADVLGVAPNSIRYWFETKVLANLSEVLANEQPGPKPEAALCPSCVLPKVSTLRMGEKVMRVRIIVQIVRVCGSGRMGFIL